MIGRIARGITAGLVGAAALTAIHEAGRALDYAPRMDVLGERALKKAFKAAGRKPPRGERLYRTALAGDLLSNGLFYSLVSGNHRVLKGVALGSAMGIGGVLLPRVAGLGYLPSNRTTKTKLLTVGYYLAGGLAAAAADRLITGPRHVVEVTALATP